MRYRLERSVLRLYNHLPPSLKKVFAAGGDPETVAGEFGMHSLYKMLGYFSLIGLCRLHSLLGDFYQAIHILENIDINKKTMYSRVPACQVSVLRVCRSRVLSNCIFLIFIFIFH